ncbi:MAG TPA: thiamine pyrophosphate-dependent enzyme [Nocardioidaceae bacterium]|nr:thiamine pyrophosphate-dependent enzyme [Nocardioidaceae bacterium]
MSTRSAGHLVVAQLEELGVPRVYCVPGESYLEVLDGLYDSPIDTIVCRQEGGAGFMAVAQGRLGPLPGVAMVTRGPGAANAAIAVHTAWQDATAMVLFVGLIPLADRGRESFQEFDLSAWFGSTSKKVLSLDTPDRAAEVVSEAFHVAASGRPGPVVVGLPEDVLVAPTEASISPARDVSDGAVSPSQAHRLASLLRDAERPLVVVGGDRWTAPVAERFTAWCESWRLPVAADFRAHDVVAHGSASYVGWLGYGQNPALADLLDEADLLLFVGDGAGDVLTGGYRLGRDAARVVVVDPDPQVRAHQLRLDLHLTAAPGGFVEGFADTAAGAAPHDPPRWAGWAEKAREEQQRFSTPHPDRAAVERAGEPGSDLGARLGVDLGAAFAELRDRLPGDALYAYGAGNYARWVQRYLVHETYPAVLAPRNGAMGFGIPAAVAAALSHPDRQVVAFAGDGCFLMNGQELATAAAYGLTPLVVVVDNGGYGTIRSHQQAAHPGRPSGTALTNPDFAAYGAAFGAHAETVTRTADVGPALDRALGCGRMALVHLVVDPDTMSPHP